MTGRAEAQTENKKASQGPGEEEGGPSPTLRVPGKSCFLNAGTVTAPLLVWYYLHTVGTQRNLLELTQECDTLQGKKNPD